MSHVLDMANMLAGPIRRVVANRKTFISSRPVSIPGQGTHFSVNPQAPRAPVTNEDYVGALVQFAHGAQGSLEACRVIKGPRCEMAFELNGTQGALKWNFERMNQLQLFLPDGSPEHDGPVLIQSGPGHPFYPSFYPGPALSMSYEDLKVIETLEFLRIRRRGQARRARIRRSQRGGRRAGCDRTVLGQQPLGRCVGCEGARNVTKSTALGPYQHGADQRAFDSCHPGLCAL
jgi:predicted dehydrogenase